MTVGGMGFIPERLLMMMMIIITIITITITVDYLTVSVSWSLALNGYAPTLTQPQDS